MTAAALWSRAWWRGRRFRFIQTGEVFTVVRVHLLIGRVTVRDRGGNEDTCALSDLRLLFDKHEIVEAAS